MEEFNIAVLVLAGSVLLMGLLSNQLKRWGLADSAVLLFIGVVLGPAGFGVLVPSHWGEPMAILEQVARLSLAIGLMGVALRLPKHYVVEQWRSLFLVLFLAMPFMWLCSSVLVGGLLGLSAGAALVLGAVVTPTDPVVASSVVTGPVAKQSLPGHLRHIISAESGANDGLAYLFVLAATFVASAPPGESLAAHVVAVLFGDVLSALLMGGALGFGAGFALRKAENHGYIEQPSILMFTTALALTTLAGVKLLGSDGILAVFIAGLAFNLQVDVRERQQEERVVEGVDRFFIAPIFILLGLMVPWREWLGLGWPGLAMVVAVLLFHRLPLFLLLGGLLKQLPQRADGVFSGWFGPIGVAALYYAALAHTKTHIPELWPAVSLLVVASILAHGLSASHFARWYARWQTNDG